MRARLHIIYLPGLGDRYNPIRRMCLMVWRAYGVSVTMVPMRWASDETYEAKYSRVEDVICSNPRERVVVMGESAGGSMALTIYAKYSTKLAGVMTLCGKNTRPDNVSAQIYARNPAFRDSMSAAVTAEMRLDAAQRHRFISVVPLYDPTVPVAQTLIPGGQKMTLPAVGHLFAILAMLTLYAPIIVRRAKNL